MNTDKYQEALDKQQAERYLTTLRNKSLQTLKDERQIIIDRIISYELFYGELNRDMNRAIREENWQHVLMIRQKVRENADDHVELMEYDSVIKEKQRVRGLRVV